VEEVFLGVETINSAVFRYIRRYVIFIFLFLLFAVLPGLARAENTALVIIDMQPYFVSQLGFQDLPGNKEKLQQVLAKQVELIRMAKAERLPIATIEYDDCGPTCATLTKEIGEYPLHRNFTKTTDGMFHKFSVMGPRLKKFLDENKVTKLLVAGANGGACVKCSIEGALEKGYRVVADSQGIADFGSQKFIHPYRYSAGTLTSDPNFSQIDGIKHLSDIAENPRPARPSIPELATGTTKIPEKLFGRLGGIATITGLFSAAIDAAELSDINSGKCPNSNHPSTFAALAEQDQNTLESIANDCRKKGKIADFSGFFSQLAFEGKSSLSRATCDSYGTVRIIHRNGITSTIKFSEEQKFASISSSPSDLRSGKEIAYRMDEKKNWRVFTKITERDQSLQIREESWQSFQTRAFCASNPCRGEDLMNHLEGYDDSTTERNPFGLFGSSQITAMSESLNRTRRILLAKNGETPAFKDLCRRLGASVPDEIVYLDSKATGGNPPAQANTRPSIWTR
jgi:nicotinamidase-related amidase